MDFGVKKRKKSIVINITSMVDVLLILLIFVLVTTTFIEQPALNIELPDAKSSTMNNVQELTVTLTKEGEIYLNDELIERDMLNIALRNKVKSGLPVMLKADRKVEYGLVIEVMDILKGLGVDKLITLTSQNTV